ncbi:hypothetical protein CERZMDRAFT_96550 [Cercospora zeae-maydis SCOH1-5]|uniref:Uncharacterized protein n=1 Tax=Cercospora zeae-maydis SCOH1-5 TaxID=717836 RepID=A0A6A6FJU9_9PEZI|nr:hypothetical protein CERZMDRAFT_96550 [Cercospora zeae-maydis SCOH1-5]
MVKCGGYVSVNISSIIMDFSGKVAIVTGCASGIGSATTDLLLKAGARVCGLDISQPSLQHERFTFQKCDLGSASSIKAAVKACAEANANRIDVLANVAGIMDGFASADTVTEEDWQRLISVNLTACMLLSQAVLPHMQSHGAGSIVNVASRAGLGGAAAGAAYTASKHGLIGLSKNIAWRFHETDIRCNVVCPGTVQTNIANSIRSETFSQEAFEISRPFLEIHASTSKTTDIQPVDVANAILFLASDLAKRVSGVVLPVDRAWGAV